MLRRKNMTLESYSCENCIWQKEETLYHLFLRCNFAKACWNSIGMTPPRITNPKEASTNLKQQLNVPFSMEIVILMTWSIWKCRNHGYLRTKTQQCNNASMTSQRNYFWSSTERGEDMIPPFLTGSNNGSLN
jgi:hypothetical protein